MAIEHHYQSPTSSPSPFDTVLAAVRLGNVGFAMDAQLGSVGTGALYVDDPAGTLILLPWQRYYALELAGPASGALTGTVAKSTTSLVLTGTGTAFLTELAPGDEVAVPGGGGTDYLYVASITDNTHATMFLAPGHAATGQTATRAAQQRLFSGWTGPDTDEDRGDSDPSGTGGNPAEAGRVIQVGIADVNTALHFRITRSATWLKTGDAGAATTTGALLAALIASPEAALIVDDGRVVYGTKAITPTDRTGQYLDAVLNTLAQIDGANFSLLYHEATGLLELVYGPPGLNDRPSPLALSSAVGDQDVDALIYPGIDAKQNRAGAGIMAGLQVTGANASSYVTEAATADTYEFRDSNASDSTLKTSAERIAYGNRQLADGTEPDDKVSVAVDLPVALAHLARRLNGIQARFPHLTGWADWRWAKILRVELAHAPASSAGVAPVTPELYQAKLVLAPCDAPAAAPTFSFGVTDRNLISEGESESVGTFLMGASGTGDSPPIGDAYSSEPKTGLLDYHYAAAGPQIGQPSGFEFLGAGVISIEISVNAEMVFDFGSPGGTTVQLLAKIGSTVVAFSAILTDTGTGLHSFDTGLSISASGIPVANGDVLQIYYAIGVTPAHIAAIPPAGTFAPPYQLVVEGALS